MLALHFELGHDFAKAMRYLGLAAESSARRFSTREAVSYLSRALDLVSHLPAGLQPPVRLKLCFRGRGRGAPGEILPARLKIF